MDQLGTQKTFSKRSEVDFETEPGVNRKNVTIFMQGP